LEEKMIFIELALELYRQTKIVDIELGRITETFIYNNIHK